MTTPAGLDLTGGHDPQGEPTPLAPGPRSVDPAADSGSWLLLTVPIAICLGLVLYVLFV